MSEDETKALDDARPFEERVISMLTAMREDIRGLDERIHTLERKSYDTKPMWERALAESIETRRAVEEVRRIAEQALNENGETRRAVEELRRIVEKNFRDFNHKNDVFHQDLLDLKWRVRDIEDAKKVEDTAQS